MALTKKLMILPIIVSMILIIEIGCGKKTNPVSPTAQNGGTNISFETLMHGESCILPTARTNLIFNNNESWSDFCNNTFSCYSDLPSINFNEKTVIAALMENLESAYGNIKIIGIVQYLDKIVVTVSERLCHTLTFTLVHGPIYIVSIPKTELPFEFLCDRIEVLPGGSLDSDNDGFSDCEEIRAGTDYLDPDSHP